MADFPVDTPQPRIEPVDRAASPARILLADDQLDILQALRLLLTDAGFQTDQVNTVDDVLARVSSGPYDLLLMDLNYTRDTTSGREGLDLLDRVRTHDSTLPIVVMTGWGSIDTAVEAMRRGARSFVQKPWEDATLVEIVRREIAEGLAARHRDARHAREQEEARLIQRALLPSAMPELSGCTLSALWTPASGIGGDCYDLLRFDDHRVAISIADVVGKGLPAALLMSNLQAAVRAFATSNIEPHDVCASVNRLLCRNIAAGKFVTFCYAVIDTRTGTLAFANAGHNPPMVVRPDGRIDRLEPTGLVLGVSPEWKYMTGRTHVGAGDRVISFTDGITEALSPAGEEFGEERLIDLVRAGRTSAPESIARTVTEAIAAWTGGAAQDDTTLIVVGIH